MSLTKPNQQLRRDLKEAAALLKWSGVDLRLQRARSTSEKDSASPRASKIKGGRQKICAVHTGKCRTP